MEEVRLAACEGGSSQAGNPLRKRKPTIQNCDELPKRCKTCSFSAVEGASDTIPLRRSGRLQAKREKRQQQGESVRFLLSSSNKRAPRTCSLSSSSVASSPAEDARTCGGRASCSSEEIGIGGRISSGGPGRPRKRRLPQQSFSDPTPAKAAAQTPLKGCASQRVGCGRGSGRNQKRKSQTQSAVELLQTEAQEEEEEEEEEEAISSPERERKRGPKRRRTTSRSTQASASNTSTVSSSQPCHSPSPLPCSAGEEKLEPSASSKYKSKNSKSSSTRGKKKAKRRRKSREELVDSSSPSPKKSRRRGATSEREADKSEGEGGGQGKRGKGKSVICEPRARGKGAEKSSKGKGKAKAPARKLHTNSAIISLPSFVEFARLNMAEDGSDQAVPLGTNLQEGEGRKGKDPPVGASSKRGGGGGGGGGGEGGGGSGGGSIDEALRSADTFSSLSEEGRRLQSMLEAQGLPPHLLGALGTKMQYILQKSFSSSMSSSNTSRAQQLLTDMESGDESTQLQACIEVGQLLVMGNEETLSGFPVKQAVPILSNLLSLEHNFDMMVNACRALTYMMEALPRSSAVVSRTIPLLVEKLQAIQCMDVAEQALSALELLSRRHGKDILQSGGLNASLLYLDFFSLTTQRCALSVAANCCYSVSAEDFRLIIDSIRILTARLQHQDKRSVESCCQCFSRLVESFSSHEATLRQIVSIELLQNLQQLLVVTPPVISSNTFVTVLKMMSTLCVACPPLAVELLKINIVDTLRYLLAGSGEITLENIELMSRSPNEVYETLSLTSHLMPPLPKDGIFEVEEIISTKKHMPTIVQWEWQDNDGTWKPYSSLDNRNLEMAHQAHEEECSVAVRGRDYVIDLASMQQINEDTGTTRSVRRTVMDKTKSGRTESPKKAEDKKEDARAVALTSDPSLGSSFVESLFAVLYEVFNSMAGSSVRNKCLKTILRILYYANADILKDILRDIPVSSHIAAMLKSQDYHTKVGGVQMAHILMDKLPDIFLILFHREGVMHEIQALKEKPTKGLPTPQKEIVSPPLPPTSSSSLSSLVTPPPGPSRTPTSTRKRLSDILRRGKRHFRRSLIKSRSEEDTPTLPLTLCTSSVSMPTREEAPPLSSAETTPPQLLRQSPVERERERDRERERERERDRERSLEEINSSASVKERVNVWIHRQAVSFLDQWCQSEEQHPSRDVVRKLTEAVEKLNLSSSDCLDALEDINGVVLDTTASGVSSFEIMYCNLVPKLISFLTVEGPECVVPLNTRLRHFVHTFMGIPEQDTALAEWSPPDQIGLVPLLLKLHGCVSQLEQFSVRVSDMPGRRGSQALKFFNTHQIKCSLERHPAASSISSWKGGPLRIDPLATLQTLERYLVVRGIGRPEQVGKRLEDLEFDEEIDDTVIVGHLPTADRHYLEFFINDQALPYNMTIFQAIRQFAMVPTSDSEEEIMPLGRPEIWIRTHTIHYRPIPPASGAGSSKALISSLPSTPTPSEASPVPRKGSSSSSGARKRASSAKLPLSVAVSLPRVTRSSSRDKHSVPATPRHLSHPSRPHTPTLTPAKSPMPFTRSPDAKTAVAKEKQKRFGGGLSPLHQALRKSTDFTLCSPDPSLPILRLMKILYALNSCWTDLYQGVAGNPVLPVTEFVNSKLTAKTTRQMQDPLNVMTGSFPQWLKDLAKHCPFLFPFECRQMLFYITTFDRDRAIARLQEQRPELATSESSHTVTPKFDRKKRCVSRDSLLEQAEKIINELASNRAMLEVHYENEVGTGLGPTLEFYTLVSRELQRADLQMWRGEHCPPLPGASQGAANTPLYVHSPVGLFPCPLGLSSSSSSSFPLSEQVCSKFTFLGKFMAKAIMDSRMLDIPLSDAFYKWMLGLEGTFTAQDLQHVDPVVARSFAQLAAVAVKKHKLESDSLLSDKALAMGIDSLSLEGGGTIEELDLDFTLPGYPDNELKPGGRDIPVTVHNLDEYLKLVVDWMLVRGVARQMEAFKEGFSSVLPLSSLQTFYPFEMDQLLCGAHHQKWDIKELMECCRPDHGYSHDSRAVQYLFEVLSTYDTAEQRQFIQFVTGTPRLPVGGFRALNPPLTIVRKTVDSPQNPDDFLPSVMTCVNYLKLPDYTATDTMRERLGFAFREGKDCFHLS